MQNGWLVSAAKRFHSAGVIEFSGGTGVLVVLWVTLVTRKALPGITAYDHTFKHSSASKRSKAGARWNLRSVQLQIVTPSAAGQAVYLQHILERWRKLHEEGETYCSLAEADLWSPACDRELQKLVEMAGAGYIEDLYLVKDLYYVDMSWKVHYRGGTSALETYHKGQHKSIVGMKVGVDLAHRSLVNDQYRTFLTARANIGGN
ncbi:hypothetical protein Ndes2526B_g07736 [Nannochloris sp. 'desiccata']